MNAREIFLRVLDFAPCDRTINWELGISRLNFSPASRGTTSSSFPQIIRTGTLMVWYWAMSASISFLAGTNCRVVCLTTAAVPGRLPK